MADGLALEAVVLEAITTYILHSTVVLVGIWLLVRTFRPGDPRVVERLWKIAALAGLVTAPVQLHVVGARPALVVPIPVDGMLVPTAGFFRNGPERPGGVEPGEDARAAMAAEGGTGALPAISALARDRSSPEHDLKTGRAAAGAGVSLTGGSQPPAREISDRPRRGEGEPGTSGGPGLVLALLVLAGFLRTVWRSLAFGRRLKSCEVLASGIGREMLDELLLEGGCRRTVVLLTSPRYGEPAAAGILKWRILLPSGAEDALDREDLRALLAHELAHLRRGDPLWLLVGQVLCTCCVFQPLNFLAQREWRRAAEVICDDSAIECGVSSISLARCLARVAEWKLDRRPCPAALGASGREADLVHRVERLLSS